MIQKLNELLPGYLNGVNVNTHSHIIDQQNTILDEKIQVIKEWNLLDCPILVERVQARGGFATFNIHIHTTSPIKSVKSEHLDKQINEKYAEEGNITRLSFTREITAPIPPVMPIFEVIVETYDGLTYTKGYKENDIIKGDIYDHDEFLDILGNFLGIPRRVYDDTQVKGYNEKDYLKLYPAFFTKSMYSDSDYITEDDFYYYQRLRKFVTEYNTKPLAVLMAELLYNWSDVTITSMIDRSTSLTPSTKKYANTPTLNVLNNSKKYVNMDYNNMDEIINQYAPLSHPVMLSEPLKTVCYSDIGEYEGSFNYILLNVETETITEDGIEKTLINAPVLFLFDNMDSGESKYIIYYTDDDGNIPSLGGIPPGEYFINIRSQGEYEIRTGLSNMDTHGYVMSYMDMSRDAWNVYRYQPRNTTSFLNTFFTDNTVNVGNGYTAFTPVFDTTFADITDYYFEFKYSINQPATSIGITRVKLEENTNGTIEVTNLDELLDLHREQGDYVLNHEHTIQVHFRDNKIYYTLQGELIKTVPLEDTDEKYYLMAVNDSGTKDAIIIKEGKIENE